jgi:hypothetical membrane protein
VVTSPSLRTARLVAVIASAVVLATTIVVVGSLTPGYRPFVDAVSRLGSHDEPHASLMRAGLVLYGLLIMAGAGALADLVAAPRRLLSLMIGGYGAAAIVAGLAPKDPPGSVHTPASRVHVDADLVGGALLLAAMALVARCARMRADRASALVAGALTLVGVIAFPFTWGAAPYGLIELLLLALASTWLVTLAARARSFDPDTVLVADRVGDAVEFVGPVLAVNDVVVERAQEHEVVHRSGSAGFP